MGDLLERATRAFPLWVVAASLAAAFFPSAFTWFAGPWITWSLGVIMLGMGLTLEFDDFARVVRYPLAVLSGVGLQFSVMPFFGWSLGIVFGLPDTLAVGLVLVSCCPGGTASNVIAYLARANVALSVSMTAISTMVAVAMTPLLTAWLAGERLEVDAFGLFAGTVKVVLLPVVLGVLLNRYATKITRQVNRGSPFVAVLLIAMIVASIIGQSIDRIVEGGFSLWGAVLSLHLAGFGLGYLLGRWITGSDAVARTISVEVGMQNSGLGAQLARSNFPAVPAVAVPSALSALTHCIYGSIVAAFWQRRAPKS
jgi:bile acid:Na+ symporter, BASS family